MSRALGGEGARLRSTLYASVARGMAQSVSRGWWLGAGACLVLAGAFAGLHPPISGGDFWHLANAQLLTRLGFSGSAAYLAHAGAALDLRSWLSDLLLLGVYRLGGVPALTAAGAVLGALLGAGLALRLRAGGRGHPLLAVLAGGLGLLALHSVLLDWPSEVLALLALGLVTCLLALRRGERWAGAGLIALLVLWTNLQADAAVAMLLIWVWVILARGEAGRQGGAARPSWWLLPLTLLAVLASPRGLGGITGLPLSLGLGNQYPLLAAWSTPDFHPWGPRLAELVGVLLLVGYRLRGWRLARADAALGLLTALLALLFANYLALFLVVAAVQAADCLAGAWGDWRPAPGRLRPGLPGRAWLLAMALPLVLALGLLGTAGLRARARAGPVGQVGAALPAAAATRLAAHPGKGAWYSPTLFGDYLAFRFPQSGRLVCLDDPLPLGSSGLQSCEQLATLNSGTMAVLRRLGVSLAVLPRAAPQVAFLKEQGWVTRYGDPTTLVLAPRSP